MCVNTRAVRRRDPPTRRSAAPYLGVTDFGLSVQFGNGGAEDVRLPLAASLCSNVLSRNGCTDETCPKAHLRRLRARYANLRHPWQSTVTGDAAAVPQLFALTRLI